MNIVATRKRLAVALSALCLCAIVVLNFIPTTEAETSPALAPTITVANAVDDVQGGPNDDGNADPGDTLEYTVTINNTAAPGAGNDGTNVVMSDTLSNILTLVPGSLVASPVVANDSYTGSGNIPLAPATSVLANDIDPLIGNNTGVTVTKVQGTGANVGVATNTTAVGRGGVTGSVIVAADGTLTYEPPPGFVGADTFTYNASKNGQESAATTVTITISNMVWFISNNAGGLNRGTFSNPFTSIAAFNTANAGTGVMPDPKSGDLVALRTGTGTYTEADGINLRAQQKVIGNAVQFSTVFTADAGSSSAYATFAGAVAAAPSIVTTAGNGVDLSTDNTVRGLNVGNTPGFFKMNGGAVGAPIINTVNLTGTGGAMNISTSGAFGSTVSFGTLESTSSPAANLNLVGVTGSITIASPGTGLSGSAAASSVVNVSGGSVGFTYTGNVTKSAGTGALVSVSGGHNGTVTFSTGTLSATAGTGFQFDNADGTYTFSGTNTMNGGDAGIDVLNGSSGTFNFSAASTIVSPTGTAFNVSTGNPTVSFLGTITDNTTAQRAVNIDGTTGGAISITTVTAGSIAGGVGNTGININNANGSVTFTTLNLGTSGTRMTAQPVTIAGGSGAKSLGTVNIFTTGAAQGIVSTTTTGAITIATGNINSAGAAAVNIAGTSAASLTPINIQLVSVNANGGASGILVSNTSSTGSPGGFRVFGTGTTDASGGTIQNTTDRGASFITAANIILNNMAFTNAGTTDLDATNGGLSTGDNLATNAAINLVTVATATLTNVDITGGAEQGINGNSVSAFSLINSTITNAGNEADEDNIHFYNMSGTSVITNTVLAHADGDDNINLQTQSGNLTLTISGGSASGSALHEGSGYLFGIRGTTNATINFNNSSGSGVTSTNNFSGGLVADVFDSATVALNVSNFTSSNNNDQISVSAGDNSNVDLNISNSTFTSTTAADFVGIGLLGSAFDTGYTFDVRILNNTINIANGLTADAMVINNAGGGLINAVVSNNTINYSGTQRAILIQGGQDGVAKSNMTVTGNTININLDGTGNAATGILAQVAVATPAPPSPGSANSFLCLDAGGGVAGLRNTFVHPLAGTMPAGDIRVRQRFDSEIRLPGYAGAANDNTAVVNYLAARNTLVNVPTATATNDIGVDPGATGFVNAGASCAQPNPVAQNGEYRLEDSNGARDLSLSMPLFSSYPASFVNMAAMERAVRAERAIRDAQLAPISGFEIEKTEEPLAPAMGAEIAADLQETESGPSSTMEVVTRLFEVISPTVHAQEERIGKAESAAPQSGETVTVNGAGTGFTLPAGKSVTIKFRATVENGPYASG
ncbi:MAG TPA: Ig-like domain-containing protein, partial [Pyrinomonadaceae bacterium]|nr:Ig-like domain-containing protein [Pyrinomonadaceae bacterium]